MSADDKPLIAFTPVQLRRRHDGWSAEKQIAFIEALAETACVEEACRRVGMSDSSAYQLRRRPCGAAFRHAWDAALDYALHRLEQVALSRALNGVPRPVFYKGEQVGEWREYDERLTMFLLRYRRAHRFGGWIDGIIPGPPAESEAEEDSAVRLDCHLDAIEDRAPEESDDHSPRALEE